MHKNMFIILLVTVVALLSVCVFSIVHSFYVRGAARDLSLRNSELLLRNNELESANSLLQTENDKLQELVGSIQTDSDHSAESTDMPQVNSLFEENPIDTYFDSMEQKYEPTSTAEMSEFAYLRCAAWKAEMVNCYEILTDMAKAERVRNCIGDEKNAYIEYVSANTELEIYLTLSNAFDGEENVLVGSLGNLVQPSGLSAAYKAKTVELFGWLHEIGKTPQFIFSEEEYSKQMQASYPEK